MHVTPFGQSRISNSIISLIQFSCNAISLILRVTLTPLSLVILIQVNKRTTKENMHLSENEGIDGNTFVVTGGLGFVGSALCLELLRRGARQVRTFDLRPTSPWSDHLRNQGVNCIQGSIFYSFPPIPIYSIAHWLARAYKFDHLIRYPSLQIRVFEVLGIWVLLEIGIVNIYRLELYNNYENCDDES